jgi:starch phosphorylase
VKQANKANLAGLINDRTGVAVCSDSIFDVQVKRIHEYKRQHLNILHVITLYRRLKNDPSIDAPPRTVIFGGKAAPSYFMAKLIIKLINSVADAVNRDSDTADRLKVVFFLTSMSRTDREDIPPPTCRSGYRLQVGSVHTGT